MPLHGKVVVIKRSGGDGTEFPLTATCLFGRKPDCDIRIQLPHVSKEHCRIDLNENKEVILTNLSSSNPTCVNGKALQQSERLKHGDVITIIDRSFRFEYPPAPTPKKRSSIGGKTESLKVRQDQQTVDTITVERGEKKTSDVSTDPHLKDGANHDNIQRSLDETLEFESTGDSSQLQSKTNSPFSDLYQMIKQSLDVKTPRKSSVSQIQTPSSRFCTPKPVSVRKKSEIPTFTPKREEDKAIAGPGGKVSGTPQSAKKQGKPFQVPSADPDGPREDEAESTKKLEETSPRRRSSTASQKFSVAEVIELVSQSPKSPRRRRSKDATPAKPSVTNEQEETTTSPKTEQAQRRSPRNLENAEKVKKRKSGEIGKDLPTQPLKKKRVSFGGHLSPELFDKRLPPDSPLRKGATPRRSFCAFKSKQSLLRRASVIGLLKERSPAKTKTPSPKKSLSLKSASPRTPSGKNSPKSRSPSPKPVSPGTKASQSRPSSPKDASPNKRSPKKASPAKSPKSRSSSPKAATPAKNSSKSESPSPARGRSPANKVETPKGKTTTPGQEACRESPINKRRSSLGTSSPASVKKASSVGATPAKTPRNSEVQTPTVQGRFSVSRISTPSPKAGVDAVAKEETPVTVTPKIPLKRRSMKSASRKTPSVSKSAVKMLQRRGGISRASIKLAVPWSDIVKFGKTQPQVVAPAKKKVTQKMIKKAVRKPQTPARKPLGHVSTGHADSPATIVVGRAHKRTVVPSTGAAPRVVANIALSKKNMKMDEDLTGISEMFKTPMRERKSESFITENSVTKTPAGNLGTMMVEPSVLHTPEEPGEMMVSPLSVASTLKSQTFNSEAVQRLLDGEEEASFVCDIPALDIHPESSEQQRSDLKTNSVTTPKQKPELPECLTGVKRMMKTPRQKAEPVEDLRGKILKTPKQKLEQQECLTGVKRIMKTPRQKAEPVEDIRGKLLVTPKQKPEQHECLTGVKRIFKTPKQKAEPLEDLRGKLLKTPKPKVVSDLSLDGVKELLETPTRDQNPDSQSEKTDVEAPLPLGSPMLRPTGIERAVEAANEKSSPAEHKAGARKLMKTPRQKGEPVEENFGIKRLMKSPRLRGAAPVEDFEGLKELMEEPEVCTSEQLEPNQDEDQMSKDCGIQEAKEPNANEAVHEDSLEVQSGHNKDESADFTEPLSSAPEQQHEVETVDEISPALEGHADKVPETDAAASALGREKKPARGRKAKTARAEEAVVPEPSEDPVAIAPVRGRRQKKTEAAAPPAVRHATRRRNAETPDGVDVEPAAEDVAPQPSEVALKPKRGRNAKKVPDPAETVREVLTEIETAPEPECEPRPPADVDECGEPPEKVVVKPRRGRKPKQAEQPASRQQSEPEDAPQADAAKEADAGETCSDQPEALPGLTDEAEAAENSPDVEREACKVPEMSAAVAQKKPVRGRRAKLVESKEVEEKREAEEDSDKPAIPAPARGRRGKKMEAAAPPAAKQMTRGRRAKCPDGTSHFPAAETEATLAIALAPLIDTCQENNDSAPPADKVASKPLRGRRTKATPVEPAQPEPEKTEDPPTAGKAKQGRKTKPDAAGHSEVVEDTISTAETEQESQPPVRAKRGRNAKQEVEEKTSLMEATECQEPAKKLRRTRKPEQDQVETGEEVQTVEVVAPEKAEIPAAEPEAACLTAKPRRGRKAKPDMEDGTPVESSELVPSTEKPKRVKRGKQVKEEVASVESPEPQLEQEEEKKAEQCVQVPKPSRAKEGKTSQVIPAKRARRGAAPPPEESAEESAELPSESAPAPVEPAKRGRRAAVKPTADEVPADSSEDLNKDEDVKKSNKSVKWKSDLEIFDIPKPTPVKAVRGRKSKITTQVDAESKAASKDANKPEEEDLSDKVVQALPAKKGRRGAKIADESASKDAEAEPQPKTRRGRSAKK